MSTSFVAAYRSHCPCMVTTLSLQCRYTPTVGEACRKFDRIYRLVHMYMGYTGASALSAMQMLACRQFLPLHLLPACSCPQKHYKAG